MKRKILSLTLASAMVLGTFGGALAADEMSVEKSTVYINGMGDKTFAPEDDVTREQIAKMISELKGLEETEETFDDVEDDSWAAGFIGAVQEAKLVEGDENGNFNPKDGLTRAQLATIIDRAINPEDANSKAMVELSDIDGHWAEEAINRLVEAGIINGYPDGTFKPNKIVTRAEAVKMLNIALSNIKSIDEDIADKVENPFEDIDESWAKDQILVASTDHRFTLDAEGLLTVVKLAVEKPVVSTEEGSTKTVVTAEVKNSMAGETATVTITPDADLEADDIVIEDVAIVAGTATWTSTDELPMGTHSVVVSVDDVESDAVEFTNGFTLAADSTEVSVGEKVEFTLGAQFNSEAISDADALARIKTLATGGDTVKVVSSDDAILDIEAIADGNKTDTDLTQVTFKADAMGAGTATVSFIQTVGGVDTVLATVDVMVVAAPL